MRPEKLGLLPTTSPIQTNISGLKLQLAAPHGPEGAFPPLFVDYLIEAGEPPGNRTPNLLIKSQLLCQLS